jgi:hypothetical protein
MKVRVSLLLCPSLPMGNKGRSVGEVGNSEAGFTAMDLETQLISHYGSAAWNFSGFGSNDPGRNRDHTRLRPKGFDATHPIDIDRQLDIKFPPQPTAAQVVTRLKVELPYTFRFELRPHSRKVNPDFEGVQVSLPPGP